MAEELNMHNTTTDNLITMMRIGAFGMDEGDTLHDMSPHKWRVLVAAAEKLRVLPCIAEATKTIDSESNCTKLLRELFDKYSSALQQQTQEHYNYSNAKLFNIMTSRRWEGVVNEETSSKNMSETTLNMLDIIIANMDDMITSDITPMGIITLGRFIRQNKASIDYDKLLRWISHIGLVQVAQLEGSMLIDCFGFTEEELPFVRKIHKKAGKLLRHSVSKAFASHSFSIATKLNVAMLETVSNRFMGAITTITDIEE